MYPIHGVSCIPKKLISSVFCCKFCSRDHSLVAASPALKLGTQVHSAVLTLAAELGGFAYRRLRKAATQACKTSARAPPLGGGPAREPMTGQRAHMQAKRTTTAQGVLDFASITRRSNAGKAWLGSNAPTNWQYPQIVSSVASKPYIPCFFSIPALVLCVLLANLYTPCAVAVLTC